MDLIQIPPPINALNGETFFRAKVADGWIRVMAATEPYHQDGSKGLHVSVSFTDAALPNGMPHGRKPSRAEMSEIINRLFSNKAYEIDNCGNDNGVIHLWEKQMEAV